MDNCSLMFEYPNGVRGNFSHHYFDPPGFTGTQERVFGSNGSIDLPRAPWQPRDRTPVKREVPNAGKSAELMALTSFLESIRDNKAVMSDVDTAVTSTWYRAIVPISQSGWQGQPGMLTTGVEMLSVRRTSPTPFEPVGFGFAAAIPP